MRFLLAIFIVALTVMCIDAAVILQCAQNEEYTECGSLCGQECNPDPDRLCAAVCVKMCKCMSGFLRNDDGHCVSTC